MHLRSGVALMLKIRWPAVAVLLTACAGGWSARVPPATSDLPPQHSADARRALLISLDAISEDRVRGMPRDVAPNLHALLDDGACAANALPAFPSVTAPGHAAISTGAYGDINGVAANRQPRLPRDQHRLTDIDDGYRAGPLRAEPIWVTAALAGLDVAAHHFTQSPQPPGYRPVTTRAADPTAADPLLASTAGADDAVGAGGVADPLAGLRARAERALALPGTAVLNGYNRTFARGIVVSDSSAPTRPATGWRGLDALPAGTLPPREASWQVIDDSVHALFYGVGRYTHARVALTRDAARGVDVVAMPADTSALDTRPLARWFSEPLELTSDSGRVFLRARLFELSADGTRFVLFHPGLHLVHFNRPDVAADYHAAVAGWAGNGAYFTRAGGLGPSLADGGDGTAEARYLETLEYVTRQFMAGTEWAWQRGPHLLLDYFPMIDEIDHAMLGRLTPETPGHDPRLATRYALFRERAWRLVDMRVAHVMRLVERDDGAALFVTGDHGMRPHWRVLRPNVVLREAGLLSLDDDGNVDLARTRAYAPSGFWISVNHTGWRDGIVPSDSITAVVDAAERALLAARGVDGEQVVTRTWRTDDPANAGLGMGGPVGGELYFELARGYYYSWQHAGPAASDTWPDAGHGFPPTSPDMHTVLCGWGSGLAAVRSGSARIIDAAPTVADWLGIPPPPQSVGTSRLPEWRRR